MQYGEVTQNTEIIRTAYSLHKSLVGGTALLTEVCHEVCIEPELRPLTSEVLTRSTANSQAGVHLDIAANGVWGGTFEKTYFDVRVFNPHAPSNRHINPQTAYRKHEQIKKRAYEQRIRGSNTPPSHHWCSPPQAA